MSSIITSILSSTVGFLFNKARDSSADKLKDGDITDAKLREIVVRELNNVNFKLDALSQKDLLSSYTFLKEGVSKLSTFCKIKNDEQQLAVLNEASKDATDVGGETSSMPSGVETEFLNEALKISHAMEKLKISQGKDFDSATERFKKAREKATEAFCNKALSIQDRILAAKFKVVSEILECLECPETAISGCMSSLEDLHSLPAVREIFSVYLNRGVKSKLYKAERVENVKSVMLINYVLYKFVSKFSSEYFLALSWPTIELAGRSFNPIRDWCEVSTRKSWGGELSQPLNGLILDEEILPQHSAVTGRGETVADCTYRRDDDIKVISSTGESKVVNLPYPKEVEVIKEYTSGLASDSNNNVYVVKVFRIRAENDSVVSSFVLFVLDENYNVKHDCVLYFPTDKHFYAIAINKNNDIIIARHKDPYLYVCDNTGQLKYKFELDSGPLFTPSLSISDKNEIITASRDDKVVQIYTDEGKLKSTIAVPTDHKIRDQAFHYGISKLIVLTEKKESHPLPSFSEAGELETLTKQKESHHLLCYSEAGELETSTCLGEDYGWPLSITSHPSGVIAIIEMRRITFF